MRKYILLIILILFIVLLFVPIVDKTSGSERVIIDNSTQEIVHPSCYNYKEYTNWLDEVTYNDAINNKGYTVIDGCSKEKLPEGKTSIMSRLLND